MRFFDRSKIFTKFLWLVLPLVVVSIAATAAMVSWTSYLHFRTTVRENYRHIVRASAGEIRLYVENARKDLEALAWMLRSQPDDPWRMKNLLSAFQFSKGKFETVSLQEASGPLLSTDTGPAEASSAMPRAVKAALSGESALSRVDSGRDNIPVVHLCVPVRRLGRVDAALCGTLNLKTVWDVLEGVRLGKSGYVFLLDPSGRLVGHPEFDRVVQPHSPASEAALEGVVTAVSGAEAVEWIERVDGTPHFRMGAPVSGLDWRLVLSQPVPEIYIHFYRNLAWVAALTVALCAAAAALGFFSVRRFLLPVRRLHEQARRLGAGELDRRVDVDTGDELSDLAGAFNAMADSLQAYIRREVENARQLAHAKNLAVLGEASSKVTHEVGNLLNNIGLAVMQVDPACLDERGQTSLAALQTEAERVRAFIGNFLQFAKPPELQLRPMSLAALAGEAAAACRPAAEAKGVGLSLVLPENLPRVSLDARLMYQVLQNLVKNAVEACEAPAAVRVEAEAGAGNTVCLRVADDGAGVEADVRDRIFDPFFTTKGKAGTGLGLSIVRSVVEAHRGTIACRSEPGEGTVFEIRIPVDGALPVRESA